MIAHVAILEGVVSGEQLKAVKMTKGAAAATKDLGSKAIGIAAEEGDVGKSQMQQMAMPLGTQVMKGRLLEKTPLLQEWNRKKKEKDKVTKVIPAVLLTKVVIDMVVGGCAVAGAAVDMRIAPGVGADKRAGTAEVDGELHVKAGARLDNAWHLILPRQVTEVLKAHSKTKDRWLNE